MAWLIRRIWKIFGAGLVGLFVLGGAAWGQTETPQPLFEIKPSKLFPGAASQQGITFSCYDIDSGIFVDCQVDAELRPLDPTFGGHEGHPGRPPLGTFGPLDSVVESVTGHTVRVFGVTYTAAEVSEEVQLFTTWTPPKNPLWLCQDDNEGTLGGVFTNPCFSTNHFDIALRGLQNLPDDPFYTVIRKGANTHPAGNFGTKATNDSLARLASLLFLVSSGQRTLSINDMSLPKGGLFDILANWAPDHKGHRRGTQADINKEGVTCQIDFALLAAIRAVGALPVCEPTGNKHINFSR